MNALHKFQFICFLFWAIQLVGQGESESIIREYPFLIQSAEMNHAQIGTGLLQNGIQNSAIIAQSHLTEYADAQKAKLLQSGLSNNISLTQVTGPSLVEAIQVGLENDLLLSVGGNNIDIEATQHGNNNQMRSSIESCRNIELNLIQVGNHNTLIQDFYQENGVKLGIIQRGNSSAIEIKHY